MICEVLVFMGMDQHCMIPDNAYFLHRGGCLISNPSDQEEYGHFPKNNDIYLNLIPAVSNGFNSTNIS